MTAKIKKEEIQKQRIVFNWNNVFIVFGFFLVLTGLALFMMYQNGNSNTSTAQPTSAAQGLKVEDLVVGTGAEAADGKTVTVNYEGTLTDGTKFDSSYDRKQPFSFTLGEGGVIKGWDMGILGMKVGGKRKLTIPPELGYGATGSPPVIPPNATLVFTVELLKVE